MKRFFVLSLAVVLCICTASCLYRPPKTKALVSTETLEIVCKGHRTTVHDIAGSQEYTFITKHVRRSEGHTEDRNVISTETISIDTLAGGGLLVKDLTSGTRYTLRPGGSCHNGRGFA